MNVSKLSLVTKPMAEIELLERITYKTRSLKDWLLRKPREIAYTTKFPGRIVFDPISIRSDGPMELGVKMNVVIDGYTFRGLFALFLREPDVKDIYVCVFDDVTPKQ